MNRIREDARFRILGLEAEGSPGRLSAMITGKE